MKWISIVLLVFSTYLVVDKSWSAEENIYKSCSPLAKVKSQLTGTDTTLTTLTSGQMNWLRGFWMGIPPSLQGSYPGTGAILLEKKGEPGGMIVWTNGPLACLPARVPPQFVTAIKNLKTGPLDKNGDEL